LTVPTPSPLAQHRPALLGLVYVVILGLLMGVCVLAYDKALPWQRAVAVTVRTDNPGLELNPNSDVKLRSRLVGRVDRIESDGAHAVIHLSLDRGDTHLIPRNVDAAIMPKTLFGEKFVELLPPGDASSSAIRGGDVIRQSRTAVELGDVYARLVPLLRAVDPAELSTVLNGLAGALDGRGQQLGRIITQVDAFLGRLDPHLDTLQTDLHQLARTLQVYGAAAPDLLRTLSNATAISQDLLVPAEKRLEELLDTVISTSDLTTKVLEENGENIVELTGRARPLLALLDTYSSVLPCSLRGLHLLDKLGNQVTGARGPFTHLNVDYIVQGDPYVYPRDAVSSPQSDASNANLPKAVPGWAPHCPKFSKLTLQVKDAGPFSLSKLPPFQSRGSANHSSLTTPDDTARGDQLLSRSLAASLMSSSSTVVANDSRTALAGLMIEPFAYDGTVSLP